MQVLLHICCAPCAIVPLRDLRSRGHQVTGYFYNPNIHPYRECAKRKAALEGYAPAVGLQVLWRDRYDVTDFLDRTRPWGPDRCRICYRIRLEAAARAAAARSLEAFTTTLLYSRFQKHEWIREEGEVAGREAGVSFFYQDFRAGWQEGVNESRALGLYRQPYCGCIFSEQERFAPGAGK